MPNLKRIGDAISTTTRPAAPEKLLGINLRYRDFVSHYLIPIFCVILKQKAGVTVFRGIAWVYDPKLDAQQKYIGVLTPVGGGGKPGF